MRTALISGVIALLLTVSGLFLALQAANRNVQNFSTTPVHPVTPDMNEEAAKMARQAAPEFKLKDPDGNEFTLKGISDGRPTLVYFIKDGCPCSIESQPMFQKLYAHINSSEEVRIPFVGIFDKDAAAAKKWMSRFEMPYAMLLNPDCRVMKAYNSPNSVYSTLVDGKGRIIKQWPGWSRRILTEMNAAMSKELGLEVNSFDTAYAPEEDASGCTFEVK